MNSHQTGGFAESTLVVVPLITLMFGPSRFHCHLQIVAATAGNRVSIYQNKSLSISKNFIHCKTDGDRYMLFSQRQEKYSRWSMVSIMEWNGNPKLVQLQSFSPYPV